MSKNNWSNILSVLARTASAFVFVFGQTAWAMQSQNAKDKTGPNGNSKTEANASQGVGPAAKAPAAEKESATAQAPSSEKNPSRGGQHEGIKVHGHWTIEVRDADGTLVTHREFENALTSSGGGELARYLARSSTVGQWNVGLVGASVLFIDEPGSAAGAPKSGYCDWHPDGQRSGKRYIGSQRQWDGAAQHNHNFRLFGAKRLPANPRAINMQRG